MNPLCSNPLCWLVGIGGVGVPICDPNWAIPPARGGPPAAENGGCDGPVGGGAGGAVPS